MSTEAPAAPPLRDRDSIPERFKWNLRNIFATWEKWESAYAELDRRIDAFATLQGTLARAAGLLAALRLRDEIGQLEYKVWYFASLWYDQDQRDNQINARRQQVQILFAKAAQASAWFDPELLQIPLSDVQAWMAARPELAVYRFAIEDLYRQQEHVLDDKGERLLSLSSRFSSSPNDAYAALSTADVKYPTVRLSTGAEATLTYGQYRAILATNRNQADRAAAFAEFHKIYDSSVNTYATLYDGVLQRDLFYSRARGYASTLDAALHGNNIPTAVVENLIQETKAGTEPLRRYHRLRKRALGVETYHSYDTSIPLVDFDREYPYEDVLEWLFASVAALGDDYARMRAVLDGQCIDVYENPARSGAIGPVLRRAALHAAQLQRHPGCGVHARARDGALDAHGALACAPALRVCRLHDLHRRGAVDAQRGAVPRVHAGALDRRVRADRPAPARDRRHCLDVLHAGDVRRLRTAGAPAGRGR
jgi:oligoendopeptidase F